MNTIQLLNRFTNLKIQSCIAFWDIVTAETGLLRSINATAISFPITISIDDTFLKSFALNNVFSFPLIFSNLVRWRFYRLSCSEMIKKEFTYPRHIFFMVIAEDGVTVSLQKSPAPF